MNCAKCNKKLTGTSRHKKCWNCRQGKPPASERRKYTKELLEEAVLNSENVTGVLRHLGLRMAGGSHSHISRMLKDLEIDCSHFTGQSYNKGKSPVTKKTAEEILVVGDEYGRRTDRKMLLRAMTEMGVPYKCAECSQDPEWNGKTLCLDIDHINGNFWDNRLENLRFLCPNCHSQQESTNKPGKYRVDRIDRRQLGLSIRRNPRHQTLERD